MRPRRRRALNWRRRRTRRDALPSIQKKSPRFVVPFWLLSGVELVVKHTCVCRDMFGDRRNRRSICGFASTPPDFKPPPSPPLGRRPGGRILIYYGRMGRRSLAGDGPGSRMRPRRRTALNWRRRRTRRDALPSIQKKSPRFVVPFWLLSGVELVPFW